MIDNNRPPAVLRNMQTLYTLVSPCFRIYRETLSRFRAPLPRGVEHSAGASFAANPLYFDPKNIVELAIEAGCNCVASTYGVLASVSRRYAHRIPFLVKLNHNETLSCPNTYDQTLYASVEQAFNMGAVAVGATIYFGSEESRRQIEEISAAFERAHELGMVTVLWAYLRNSAFKKDGVDYHVSADLTGQANHLAATIGADIVKQKWRKITAAIKAEFTIQVQQKKRSTHQLEYNFVSTQKPFPNDEYFLPTSYNKRARKDNDFTRTGQKTSRNCQSTGT